MASIPIISSKDPAPALVAALERDGCAVVTDGMDRSTRDAFARELAPHVGQADANEATDRNNKYFANSAGFYPGHTKRITVLIAKSETFRGFVTHPMMLAACDVILKPNCDSYQLHVGSALAAGPGATLRVLHRDDGDSQFFKV